MRLWSGAILCCLIGTGLSACGQKGPLVLPSQHNAKEDKAVYLIKPHQSNGEIEPTVRQNDPAARADISN